MARDTIARDTHVIENLWREPRGRMAKVTILRRRQMVHCRILTGSELTVVTTFAATCNALMSKTRGWKTRTDDVTRIAIIRCRNMSGRLASRDAGVMTGRTVVNNARVVEDPALKGSRPVTENAILSGWYVIDGHSSRVLTVVAGRAVVDNARARVVKVRNGKNVRLVAD